MNEPAFLHHIGQYAANLFKVPVGTSCREKQRPAPKNFKRTEKRISVSSVDREPLAKWIQPRPDFYPRRWSPWRLLPCNKLFGSFDCSLWKVLVAGGMGNTFSPINAALPNPAKFVKRPCEPHKAGHDNSFLSDNRAIPPKPIRMLHPSGERAEA